MLFGYDSYEILWAYTHNYKVESNNSNNNILLISMVLKTGPDRPVRSVQPGTGIKSDPVIIKNWK